MGHYDSDYEHADEQRRKARRKELKAFAAELAELRLKLPQETPKRFEDVLEDLSNWIRNELNT